MTESSAPHGHLMRRSDATRVVSAALVCLAAFGSLQASAQDRQSTRVLSAGPLRVTVSPWQSGMRIYWNDLLISRGSGMVITTPPWAPHYYLGPSPQAVDTAEQRPLDDGVRLIMHHADAQDQFTARDVITLRRNGELVREVTGEFHGPGKRALIQWRIAGLNPVLFIGRPYKAMDGAGRRHEGAVPVEAQAADALAAALVRDMRWIEFDSRIGPVRIEIEATHPIICFDYRRNKWADPTNPQLWLGDYGSQFDAGTQLTYRIRIKLPSAGSESDRRPAVVHAITTTSSDHAQTWPLEKPPTLIPRPKQREPQRGNYTLAPTGASPTVRLITPPGATAESAAEITRKAIARRFGLQSRIRSTLDQSSDQPAITFETWPASRDRHPEAYELSAGPDGVTLRADTAAGFRNAAYTLNQLLARTPAGAAIVRGAKIADQPSLDFRGVHLFTGAHGPELHERLLCKLLAPLKLNHLVFECEYIEWDSAPEIHHPEYGMPKSDVRQILDTARELGIEVTPLVNSLGHAQWMFTGGHNLELAEDPEAKWAYCVTNPDTYDFLFRIYDETLELFHPRYFHIGHDEFTDRGRVPYRDSSRPYTIEALFLMDTLKLHGWLEQRHVRTMMWGDMLLSPGEAPDAMNAPEPAAVTAPRMRETLPDDIIITDWHYAGNPPGDFTSPKIFRNEGHDVIASTWSRPANIVNFASAAYDNDALGLLQTTWAGYSLDPDSFQRELHQYMAYVLAAEAAWNADDPPAPGDYPHGEYFLRLMEMSDFQPANRPGWTADLAAAHNYATSAADATGWFGLGPEHDLSALPRDKTRLEGILFQLAAGNRNAAADAVALTSRLAADADLPLELTLNFSRPRTAGTLALLHGTNFPCDAGALVARCHLHYTGGEQETTELVYGKNTFAFTDPSAAPAAPILWRGKTPAGAPLAARVLLWENPHPQRPIQAIHFKSANAAGSFVLLGITGLQ